MLRIANLKIRLFTQKILHASAPSAGGCIVYALAENRIVKHTTSILKTFKSFYSNLAGDLLVKLPKLPNQYAIRFVSGYYEKLSSSKF